MKVKEIIDRLESNGRVFYALLNGVDHNQTTWRPEPDMWSLLEIVCHLLDEEIEDFRQRTKVCLENPGQSPPAINPGEWVKSRDYQSRDFQSSLDNLIKERSKSTKWLRSLSIPNWSTGYNHSSLGFLSAHFFLENWLAHDYMHIRQINRTKFLYFAQNADHSLEYAGNW